MKVGQLELNSPGQAVIAESYDDFYLSNDIYLAVTKELGANFVNGEVVFPNVLFYNLKNV